MIVERIADGGESIASGKGTSDELLDRRMLVRPRRRPCVGRVRRGADISSRDAPTDISRPMPSLGHVLIRVSLPVSSPALWGAVTVSDGNSLLPPDRRAASSRQAGDGGRDRARICSAACVRETARDAAGWVRLSEFGAFCERERTRRQSAVAIVDGARRPMRRPRLLGPREGGAGGGMWGLEE